MEREVYVLSLDVGTILVSVDPEDHFSSKEINSMPGENAREQTEYLQAMLKNIIIEELLNEGVEVDVRSFSSKIKVERVHSSLNPAQLRQNINGLTFTA